MKFVNSYEDVRRAEAYGILQFPGTYHLAYRDLPALIAAHANGKTALDFGCGTGRSTRFLKDLGFEVTGVDIAREMIEKARDLDPGGDYRLLNSPVLADLEAHSYDLILVVFTFDNIPSRRVKLAILQALGARLRPGGRVIAVVSRPEIYLHEWASFSTRDFPENRGARSGDRVRIVITDGEDDRPVEDVLTRDRVYRRLFRDASLEMVCRHLPLGTNEDPVAWVNETNIPPWCVYILKKQV